MSLFLRFTACFLLVSLSSSALFAQEPSGFWGTFTLIGIPVAALLNGLTVGLGHGDTVKDLY
jgi:hypothetical protein